MKKTDVYVVVDTPKKAKKLTNVLDTFKEKHGGEAIWNMTYWNGARLFCDKWCPIEIETEVDNEVEVSIKELRNILAKEHLKAGDVVIASISSTKYLVEVKSMTERSNGAFINAKNFVTLREDGSISEIDNGGAFTNFIRYATEEEKALLEPKKELEIGKWYKTQRSLFNHQDGYDSYGFFNKQWKSDNWKTNLDDFVGVTPVQATPQELEQALVEEAKSRYKVGDVIKCLDGVEPEVRGNSFVFSNNCLFLNGERVDGGDWFNTSGKVFENGQWADIIKQDDFTDSDVAIVEQLHDTLLDSHGYSLGSKLLLDARMLVSKIKENLK